VKTSKGTIRKVLDYVGNFLEASDFLNTVRSEETVSEETAILSMSIDSTSVLIRHERWRHATTATVSAYDAQGNRLNTVYIGRMPGKVKTQAKRLLEKEVEAIMTKHKFKHIT